MLCINIYNFHSCSFDPRLGTWHTFDEFREACIKAARRNFSLMNARLVKPTEEQLRQREEQDRKFLMIALGVYTKQNNLQVIPISINNYCSGHSSMTILCIN
jgi:hypothetical protein